MIRSIVFALALGIFGVAQAQLPEPVSQLLQAAQIPEDAVGILVVRGNTVLVSHGAGRSMQPASTLKLLTTLVGLEQLGPIFRGRTELRSTADVVKGVLQGDLILRGGADVDFTGTVLEALLQRLRFQGITAIGGDVIVNRQLFRPARPDVGAAQFDDASEFAYNVIPDALLLNTNLLQIDLNANAHALKLVMLPAMEDVSIGSDMRLSNGACSQWEEGWQPPEVQRGAGAKIQVILHGSFPRNCEQTIDVSVLDREDYVERLFRATWRRLGGSLRGTVREGSGAPGARLLADHVARALPEIVRDINKPSNNVLARTLYLSLGSLESDNYYGSRPLANDGTQDTAARADLAVRAWMQEHAIPQDGLVLENGSGLSRQERISPAQLAAVLQAGSRSAWAPEFLSSLPIAALDGTMRKRLADSPAAGRARIKTGSLKNVVAVAGYVPDANGQSVVVVGFINHELADHGAGRKVLDALIDWVARSGG